MAAQDRMAVLNAIYAQSVIPVFYHPDAGLCVEVIRACAEAGAKCVEFTNRGDFAAHVFLEVSRHFAASDASVILGAGSIVDAPTAALYIANGAKFVVSPLTDIETARLCNRRGIPYSPGCGSATEIGNAQELGCELIKIFPGSSVGGPGFVKNILGPMPWTRLMPTGGVEPTEESLRQWFGAGIVACGIGSQMITRQLLETRDFKGIEANVRRTLELVAVIKAGLAAGK